MNDGSGELETLLKFAEQLIFEQTKIYCSELQHSLLLSVLQGERRTYDQIAVECGYSLTYIRQDIAPKLWQTFTQALGKKVTKANVRAALENAIATRAQQQREARETSSPPAPSNSPSPIASYPGSTTTPYPPTDPHWSSHDESGPASDTPDTPSSEPNLVEPNLVEPNLTPSDLKIQPNILLVDDQPQNLRLLADLLEEQGYEVQEAIDGQIALKVVSQALPDLILLDITMPDMDGYSVCQQLKSDPRTQDIPVIFISAMDESWDKVKAFSVGGVDYITKPFKVVEVLARVKNQLTMRQLQQELKAQNAQLRQAIQELQRLAVIDPVTQLANRYRFDQVVQAEWQQAIAQSTSLSLILCHLDAFEAYLQTHGYLAGDRSLFQVAQAIKRVVQRSEDLVCRYGGSIFAIVLPNSPISYSRVIGQSILSQIAALRVIQPTPDDGQSLPPEDGETPPLTASIGIASLQPKPGQGIEDLVENCYGSLQTAKKNEGNTLVIADI